MEEKNIMNICVPLIFSTLDRIELISNAMELRGFGKHKNGPGMLQSRMKRSDWFSMLFGAAVLAGSLALTIFVNGSRFWNPFI